MLNGIFGIDNRLEHLTENGDILVPWERFRPELSVIYDMDYEKKAERRPFDVVLRTSEYRLLYFDGANRIKWRHNDKRMKKTHKKPVISMSLT